MYSRKSSSKNLLVAFCLLTIIPIQGFAQSVDLQRLNNYYRYVTGQTLIKIANIHQSKISIKNMITATRPSNGFVALAPTVDDQDLGVIAYLSFPGNSKCELKDQFYRIAVTTNADDTIATARFIDNQKQEKLINIYTEITREHTPAPSQPTLSAKFGPHELVFSRWFRCSTGIGHCGYAFHIAYEQETCQ